MQLLDALRSSLSTVDVDACEPGDLDRLMRSVRGAQQALDRMVMQIGVAAARLADAGSGRGAHGVLLADGRSVHGRNARREVDRARIVAEFGAVRAAVDGWQKRH